MQDFIPIIRFKNYGTQDAIAAHKEVLQKNGKVWAGWWAKPDEYLPIEKMSKLACSISTENQAIFYLLNCENNFIFPIQVSSIRFDVDGEKIYTPDEDSTPDYYRNPQLLMWLEISAILDPISHDAVMEQYAYCDFHEFRTLNSEEYCAYNGKIVSSIKELSEQRRSLMFVRQKREGDSKFEVLAKIHKLQKTNFTDSYAITNSNSILLLSDLHFTDDETKFQFAECKKSFSNKALSKAIQEISPSVYSSMILAGDLTYQGSEIGYELAERFIFAVSNNHNIDKNLITMVPGNHDIEFGMSDGDQIDYANEKSKENYINLYRKVYGTEPNAYLANGRRFLLKNRLPIEIVGLNSNSLQQIGGHFAGMGFVGDEQLQLVEREMKWDLNRKNYAFRILVIHHHLFPVEYIQEPHKDCSYSLCLDAGLIESFIIRNNINLIIHGHKHKSHFIQIDNGLSGERHYKYSVLGLGSASSTDVSMDEKNTVAILDFDKQNNLKIKIVGISNSFNTEENIVASYDIPIF